jgi:hypothetical protein
MIKDDRIWQAVTALLVVVVLVVAFMFKTQQEAQNKRLTTLEQDIQTIKESLDAKGFTDLNF